MQYTLQKLLLNTLKENNISLDGMISQCYDGATVMSGCEGGITVLIRNELKRPIPYIHCFNHQYHLIVIHLVKLIPDVSRYFDHCRLIHKIFSHFKFKKYYEGKRTSRLLEQQWSGHLKVTEVIYNNYGLMIESLNNVIKNDAKEFDGDSIVESTGLLIVMRSKKFVFILCTMLRLLRLIEPADKAFQSRESSLSSVFPLISSVFSSMKDYRSDEKHETILKDCNDLLALNQNDGLEVVVNADEPSLAGPSSLRSSKRKLKSNSLYNNFILTESSGLYYCEDDKQQQHSHYCKDIYFEIFDTVINEMNERFFENQSLYDLIDRASNFDFENINLNTFKEINENFPIPCAEELHCVKNYFKENNVTKNNYLKSLYEQRTAFKVTYQFYATIQVFACSSAVCEASLSSLSRVDTPFGQSMLFNREADLTILPFERKKTEAIDPDVFLRLFNSSKNRKLQLF